MEIEPSQTTMLVIWLVLHGQVTKSLYLMCQPLGLSCVHWQLALKLYTTLTCTGSTSVAHELLGILIILQRLLALCSLLLCIHMFDARCPLTMCYQLKRCRLAAWLDRFKACFLRYSNFSDMFWSLIAHLCVYWPPFSVNVRVTATAK